MKSIRTIVKALPENDVIEVKNSFYRDDSKVAILFNMLLSHDTDDEIRETLGLSPNAYSTLRSRLHTKVQNHLIAPSDNPTRADVLNKLLTIDDIIFTQEPTIALTTLKKLERELIRFDLSNELTVVYKYLKKLHLNTAEYFHYSQLYNRHVAYSLALDKAEDLLAKYYKGYGYYYVMGDSSKKLELTAIFEEMKNVCALYQSHRMFVHFSALQITHRLFVDENAFEHYKLEPIEDVLAQVDETLRKYPKDDIYIHLHLLFNYIRFEYYYKHGIIAKARVILTELNTQIPKLLIHYENYSFPAQLLIGSLRLMLEGHIDNRDFNYRNLFDGFSIDNSSTPAKVVYHIYRALTCYYARDFANASKWLFDLNNEVSFKEHNKMLMEVKCLTAYIKFSQKDDILFKQNLTSAQRTLRIIGAENTPHLAAFVKMLSILNSESSKNKEQKLRRQLEIIEQFQLDGFHPTLYLKLDLEYLLKRFP
jgi:hypothetical protein